MKGPEDIKTNVAKFAEERDWEKFHSPKNLVTALSIEVAELMEAFQWLTEEQSAHLSAEKTQAIRHEIAFALQITGCSTDESGCLWNT